MLYIDKYGLENYLVDGYDLPTKSVRKILREASDVMDFYERIQSLPTLNQEERGFGIGNIQLPFLENALSKAQAKLSRQKEDNVRS
jgi:hypothetical protein